VRISSQDWQRDRWFDGVLFALLAHGIAIVALVVVAGRHGTRVETTPRVTMRERVEHLRFVAPPVEAPVPQVLAHSGQPSRPRPTAPGTSPAVVPSPPPVAPAASVAAPSVAATGLLASALPVMDRRLLVGPIAAGGVADPRVRDANASIALGVRAVQDSIRRHELGWTVGDSTHRFGVAPCGIYVGRFCIPFRLTSMPNPRPAFAGVDRDFAHDAEVDSEIARVRAMNARPEP
jgi:hypothetical protein